MRNITFLVIVALSACGSPSAVVDSETSAATEGKPAATMKTLRKGELVQVCKAGAAFRGSEPFKDINARNSGDDIVRVSYVRKSDGKRFQYDCRVEDDQMFFRMIDESGPGTGPGGWSGRGSIVTFEILPEGVRMTETFGPGDAITETIAVE